MSTVERVPQIFGAFFCRFLALHQSSIKVTILKPIVHRGVQYGLKIDIAFSDTKQLLFGCREQLRRKHTALYSKVSHLMKGMKSKKFTIVLKLKKMFLFEKFDKNF